MGGSARRPGRPPLQSAQVSQRALEDGEGGFVTQSPLHSFGDGSQLTGRSPALKSRRFAGLTVAGLNISLCKASQALIVRARERTMVPASQPAK